MAASSIRTASNSTAIAELSRYSTPSRSTTTWSWSRAASLIWWRRWLLVVRSTSPETNRVACPSAVEASRSWRSADIAHPPRQLDGRAALAGVDRDLVHEPAHHHDATASIAAGWLRGLPTARVRDPDPDVALVERRRHLERARGIEGVAVFGGVGEGLAAGDE